MTFKTATSIERIFRAADDASAGGAAAAVTAPADGAAAQAGGAAADAGGTAAAAGDVSLIGGDGPAKDAADAAAAAALAKTEADAKKEGALAVDPAKNADGTPKTPEQIAADEKAAKEAKDAADAKAAKDDPEVPEGTPFALKAPAGFEGLDEAALTAAQPILRSLGIKTNGRAQEVVDAFAKDVLPGMIERGVTAERAKIDEMVAATRKEWADASRADKEIGGSPEKVAATVASALRFRDRFGTPALTELLNASGIGNHPEVIRLFAKAGKAISEGAFHVSDASAQVRGGPETRLYGAEFQPKT